MDVKKPSNRNTHCSGGVWQGGYFSKLDYCKPMMCCCRKHRVSRAMELSCSWVPNENSSINDCRWYCTLRRRRCEDTGSEDFSPLANRAGQIGATQIGWLLFATAGLTRVVPPHLRYREHKSCGDVPTLRCFAAFDPVCAT